MQFVQRRPTCEAMQVTESNAAEVAVWCGGFVTPGGDVAFPAGEMLYQAAPTDYVVKRPGADFVRMSGDAFAANWEAIEVES